MQSRPRFTKYLALVSLAVLGLPPSASVAGIIASSDFSANDDGWRISGDSTSSLPVYHATGGNPGGYIQAFDQVLGGVWFWDAPAKFLGNDSAAYGQTLTWDQRMRGDGPLFDDYDVVLHGAGLTLVFHTSSVPTDPAWASYSVLLSETAGWQIGSLGGPAPTQAQFLSVLSNLDTLDIRGEFITGPDNGDLDNVVLHGSSVPEPGSIALLGVGAFGLMWYGRRSRARGCARGPVSVA